MPVVNITAHSAVPTDHLWDASIYTSIYGYIDICGHVQVRYCTNYDPSLRRPPAAPTPPAPLLQPCPPPGRPARGPACVPRAHGPRPQDRGAVPVVGRVRRRARRSVMRDMAPPWAPRCGYVGIRSKRTSEGPRSGRVPKGAADPRRTLHSRWRAL